MNRIRELRKKSGFTQLQFSQRLNISQSTISGWEHEKWQPDNETLLKLADFFGVSVDYLLGRDSITPEERAAGASATRKENITPLEDELLYQFRLLKKNHGEETQRAVVTMITNMNQK